jgi:hypothetical protein
MKGTIFIIQIRRFEADALRKNGYSNYVKRSFSRNPSYYLVTNSKALKFFNEYNKSIKVKK